MTEVNWQRRATRMRWMVLSSYVLLLLVIAAGTLIWPGRGRAPNAVVWIALSLPLLVVLPGLIRAKVSSHSWLSFIAMLYFALAVVNLFAPPLRLLDVLELILSIELFVGCMFYVRWQSRALRAAAAESEL
jgi:uncharacterized membrane protein